MSARALIPAQPVAAKARLLTHPASALLQRKCECGGSAGLESDCEDCKKKKLQRRATGNGPATAPPIVHDVLRSPGQALDEETRSYFEPRFGHDFSKVRVHTDARAAESAKSVSALAYAVGDDLVFGSGHFAPDTNAGRKLLAHELTHVVQQNKGNAAGVQHKLEVGPTNDPLEQEAGRLGEQITSESRVSAGWAIPPPSNGSKPRLQRAPQPQVQAVQATSACVRLVSFTATSRNPDVNDTHDGRCRMGLGVCSTPQGQCGSTASSGTVFSATVEAPSGCVGELAFMQNILSSDRRRTTTAGVAECLGTTTPMLDGGHPWKGCVLPVTGAGRFTITRDDCPYLPVQGMKSVSANEQFRTFLLWKRSGDTARQPIANVQWAWSGSSTRTAPTGCAQSWTAPTGSHTDGTGTVSKNAPVLSPSIQGQQWHPCSQTQTQPQQQTQAQQQTQPQQQSQSQTQPRPSSAGSSGVLQRAPANPTPQAPESEFSGSSASGECEECKKKELQRKAVRASGPAVAPPIVDEVLRSSGQPLDFATRNFFEPRLGHDFSKVRVHADEKAAESAKSVNAQAFTVGQEIVFGAGQFQPETPRGQTLLAHELAHAVQQKNHAHSLDAHLEIGSTTDPCEAEADRAAGLAINSRDTSSIHGFQPSPDILIARQTTARVQREPETCDIKPVEDECKGAGAKCQTAKDYCTKEFRKPEDLDKRITDIKANIGASEFGPNAKKNFLHFLDGSGTEVVMPSQLFEKHKSSREALLVQRDKFIEGAQKRLEDGRLVNGGTAKMHWLGHAEGFTASSLSDRTDDLAYAVGGYQLCSIVRVKATKMAGNKFKIEFVEWKCQAFDCYNWDPGKGISLPGLSDNDMCCIENAKKGQHFMDKTDVWDNKFADSTKDFEVDASPPSGASGSSGGSSSTGSGSSSSSSKKEGGGR